jgi:hypothetical protein
MNKIIQNLFLSILVFSFGTIGAQSYQLENVTSYDFGAVNEDLEAHTYVKNISGSLKRVLVKSEVISMPTGSQTYFCWVQCYEPTVTEAPAYIEVADGEVINNFHGYLRPNGIAGTSEIRFTFYSVNAPEDSIQLIGHFEASPVGIKDVKVTETTIIAYPNPADDKFNISYKNLSTQDATLEVFNMLGTKVASVSIRNTEGIVTIPTDQLKAGVYFYTLRGNGKTSKPGRITVKH